MTFSSISFLFYFLPLLLGLYFATPWKNAALLAGSLIFYAWGEPFYVLALLVSVCANHALARALGRRRSPGLLAAGIALNLGALVWFKYAAFLVSALAPALALLGADIRLAEPPHLPLGVSFYTFQALSLLIDIWRRDAEPPKTLVNTALYITFFPQLIAGPIVRFKEISEQFETRTHSFEEFAGGARLFVLGLAQKTLLANTFAPVADAAFEANAVGALSLGAAWIGLAAYTLQIFFDFAGYSNMALGLGRMCGFNLPRNFDFPYAAQSLTEFWRRWHITLSRWFRDYLYIPLGGSRSGPARTYLNLCIVFLLCGLWHGAAVTFLVWGAWHGAFLVAERVFLGRALATVPAPVRHVYLILVVALGWVLFRAASIAEAGDYYFALSGGSGGAAAIEAKAIAPDGLWAILVAAAAVAIWPVAGAPLFEAVRTRWPASGAAAASGFALEQAVLVVLFTLCAAALAGGAYNPFIYFRF